MVRTIVALFKIPHADGAAKQRIAGDNVQRTGGHHEVGGHHQVQFRTRGDAMRIESFTGRMQWPLAHQVQVVVEFGNAAWLATGGGAHLCD